MKGFLGIDDSRWQKTRPKLEQVEKKREPLPEIQVRTLGDLADRRMAQKHDVGQFLSMYSEDVGYWGE